MDTKFLDELNKNARKKADIIEEKKIVTEKENIKLQRMKDDAFRKKQQDKIERYDMFIESFKKCVLEISQQIGYEVKQDKKVIQGTINFRFSMRGGYPSSWAYCDVNGVKIRLKGLYDFPAGIGYRVDSKKVLFQFDGEQSEKVSLFSKKKIKKTSLTDDTEEINNFIEHFNMRLKGIAQIEDYCPVKKIFLRDDDDPSGWYEGIRTFPFSVKF